MSERATVCYEDFGAVGDGVTDDFEAIRRAHAHANAAGLAVVTNPAATYYIGAARAEALVMTDTDWRTSRFLIDDAGVAPEDRHWHVFRVCSPQSPIALSAPSLRRGQDRLEGTLPCNAFVVAENAGKRQFLRVGLNQSDGETQTDCFLADRSGAVLTPLAWDFDAVTRLTAYPIDARPLTLTGGLFTTIANRAPSRYTYYARGLLITRSNVRVDRLCHTVEGEGPHGAPYHGFVRTEDCAFVTFRDCHFSGHRIYETIGSAGKPVLMGTYDISLYRSIGVSFLGCRQDSIMDRTRWGVFTSNYCKDLLVDGCTLSRVDAHMDVSNLTVRNSVIGWMGIKAVGRGRLLVENVTTHAGDVVELRMDYGSTWDGDITLCNVDWYPTWRPEWRPDGRPALITGLNTGGHDFGYPCRQPRSVTVDSVRVMDEGLAAEPGYDGVSVLQCPPQMNADVRSFGTPAEGDAPCRATGRMDIRAVRTESGAAVALWSGYPARGYADRPHDVRDGAFVPNCTVRVADVDRLLIETPDSPPQTPYAYDRRLVPKILVRDCGAVVRRGDDTGAYPMRIVQED